MSTYDVVIIGSGQAGISMGYYLKKEGVSFILIDECERVGDAWRKRYDSLVLFTPRKYSSLPEMEMSGPLNVYPTKNEMGHYLESYVRHFDLPIEHNTKVENLSEKAGVFHILTNRGRLTAKKVVVATGAFQKPYIPPVIKTNEYSPFHIHSSAYRSPKEIQGNTVLVVGGGNSGAQIAVELAEEKKVAMAVNHPFKFLPMRFLGRSIFSWLEDAGLLFAGIDTRKGKWFQKQSDPIFGKELKSLIKKSKIKIYPRVTGVEGNEAVFEDNSRESFDSIVWSTGFAPSYEWISIDGAISADGKPIHERGITPVNGLFFLGLPWQYQRGSALICGVSRDAEYLVRFIKNGVKDPVQEEWETG
jgi:putative flavoprotein involved in K+ transport